MYHAAALEHSAHSADLSAQLELYGYLLFTGIRSHYSLESTFVAVIGKSLCETVHSVCDRLYGEHLTDNAGGSHDNVLFVDAESLCGQLTHLFGLLHAVGVTGIGVYRVYDNRSRPAVLYMLLCYKYGSSLDFIGGIYRRSRAHLIGYDERQVVLLLCGGQSVVCSCICSLCIIQRLVGKSTLNSVGSEALCSAHASLHEGYAVNFNKLHAVSSLIFLENFDNISIYSSFAFSELHS